MYFVIGLASVTWHFYRRFIRISVYVSYCVSFILLDVQHSNVWIYYKFMCVLSMNLWVLPSFGCYEESLCTFLHMSSCKHMSEFLLGVYLGADISYSDLSTSFPSQYHRDSLFHSCQIHSLTWHIWSTQHWAGFNMRILETGIFFLRLHAKHCTWLKVWWNKDSK